MLRSLYAGAAGRVAAAFHELAKFGTVGALAFVVDVTIFNAVLGAYPHKPLTAKILSTVVAATLAFVLNRAWSFRHRQRSSVHREYSMFFILNAVGLLIAVSCLGLSHYVLGLHGKLADNISANGFGLVLGTLFRFWSYRRFVWVAPRRSRPPRSTATRRQPRCLEDVADGTIHAPTEAVTPA